jgi:UDP-3-O-acyl-N-acetylglucosamine deacetylase
MADPKGSKAAATDGVGIHNNNTINVALEDLTEEDGKVVKRELEEEMTELRKRKLACFQKTRGGVVKKSDTATATSTKVNSQLNHEDLAHMIDVSVTGKYGSHT